MKNLYDFDHTMYNGDASFDFILFVMRRHPRTWRYFIKQGIAIAGYILGIKNRKQVKQDAFAFLRSVENVDDEIAAFWRSHSRKIFPWYTKNAKDTDIVASASPEFLLAPLLDQLGIVHYVATVMDKKTGRISGENCRAQEKVHRLKKVGLTQDIAEVYSDSMSDMPIFKLGHTAYIIKKGGPIALDQYKPSVLSRLKSPAFIRFLLVGGLNAFLGVGLSFAATFIVENAVLAFVTGFTISLVPSYFLNSVITFKDTKFSFRKFFGFCGSYIPNFLIQLFSVAVLIGVFKVVPLITYLISVLIAVPLTFILLSVFTFKKQ